MRQPLPAFVHAAPLFALLTGIAAWFWCDLFANPLVGLAAAGDRAVTAACAALVGAVVGVLLAPAAPVEEGQPPRPSPARITAVVLVAGALAGGSAMVVQRPESAGLGAASGFFCAISFVPVATLAVAVLRQSRQARRGSIVARADGRAFLAVVALVLGGCTALSVLDAPAAALGLPASHRNAMLVALGAGVLLAGLLFADVLALRRVERLARSMDNDDEDPAGQPAAPVGRVDLGVGDAIVTRAALGTAYRGGGAALTCITGDFDEAIAALRRSIRRGALMLALLEAVGLAHGMARSTDLAADHGAWLCEEGSAAACRPAALLVERAGRRHEEAERLHRKACEAGVEQSCYATDLLQRVAVASQ